MRIREVEAGSVARRAKDQFSNAYYFPTVVYSLDIVEHEHLNDQILHLIYAERARDREGVERSNFRALGGGHSHSQLHQEASKKPLATNVIQAESKVVRDLGYNSERFLKIGNLWSIINPPGSCSKVHILPGSH